MANALSNNQIALPIFVGEKYDYWSIKMKTFFKSQGLWEIVDKGFTIPIDSSMLSQEEQTKLAKDMEKDNLALYNIQMAMEESIFPRICGATSAKEAWDTLKEEFQGNAKVRTIKLQSLRRELENMKMKDSETIKEYYSRLRELVNQLRANGEDIVDKRVVEKILISLPEKYDPIVTTMEETKDISTLSVTELVGSLEAYEKRLSRREGDSIESAFKSKLKTWSQKSKLREGSRNEKYKAKEDGVEENGRRKSKYPPCRICKKSSHLEKDCWFRGKPQCQGCGKFGHVQKECRSRPSHHANLTEEDERSNNMFYACHAASEARSDTWYIDSGCSNHMTSNEKIFQDIDKSVTTKVKLGDGSLVEAEGLGTIAVNTKKGTRLISDVLLVPKLDTSLLSVGQMIEKGYSLVFEGDSCTIYDTKNKSSEVAKIRMQPKRNFPINMQHIEVAMKAQEDNSWIWHRRFGHFNYNGLKILHQKNMMRDLPAIHQKEDVCEGCLLGKQHRKPFPSDKAWRAKKVLELVHTDVCGPMRTPSMTQNRYFILFIDDYTRMTWVYFMREKSEVFKIFTKFKNLVENQSNQKIKVIRSDRGKEYTSNAFNKFCEDEGVEHQLTVGYAPEQNGVSERKNRTVMEMARSMLEDKGMPKTFWAEAVYTAVYLLNRCPTKAVLDKTPIEAWSGRKPSAKHLKVFGSICYVHIPTVKRHKLEEKTEKGIFLGYSTESKGYRIYNLKTKKIVISRDVEFDERATWDWEKEEIIKKTIMVPRRQNTSNDQVQEPEEVETPRGSNSPGDETNEEESSPESPPRRTRTLEDIYETCNFAAMEPTSFDEASKHQVWIQAMEEEIKMIEKNKTWEMVDRPPNKEVIGVKWVYKTKLNPEGSVQKHKARLVAKGYSQLPGIDYTETFAPVARLDTIRALIALAAQKKWSVYQLDVKSAFLNGYLEEEIYVEQPQGFVKKGKEDKVLRLRKALYGLKQAPRAWYSRIDNYFTSQGFRRSLSEPTLYIKTQGTTDTLIVSLYVDDLIYTGNNEKMVKQFKEDMMKTFEMSDLGTMHYFLGIEVNQNEEGIFVSQKKYTENILMKFRMHDCKPVATPVVTNEKLQKEDGSPKADASLYRSLIGSLLYLSATRPDIMYATSLLSRFMQSPSKVHYGAAKRILRYLQGTKDYGIWYKPITSSNLTGYTDSDWAGSLDDMKSTSGYTFSLGSGIFSWASKKQDSVAQSSAEAEYIAAAATASQAIWLRRILTDMGEEQTKPTTIYCDNKSAIAMAKNPVHHSRTKHIAIKYHFLREAEANKEIQVDYCPTEEQLADIFTKALPRPKFEELRKMLGITKMSIKEEC